MQTARNNGAVKLIISFVVRRTPGDDDGQLHYVPLSLELVLLRTGTTLHARHHKDRIASQPNSSDDNAYRCLEQ